ncbi:MAG: type II toxin-antitoxin system VapC family toxin [Pseudomonadota bacterium]
MFLLDTVVVSERTKPRPNPKVSTWLAGLDPQSQFLSVITIGEIRYGVERLPSSANKLRLERWFAELTPFFVGRVLSVDLDVAERWGELRHQVRRTISATDSLIAATADVHNLIVATRNTRDFADLGVRVVNPWE